MVLNPGEHSWLGCVMSKLVFTYMYRKIAPVARLGGLVPARPIIMPIELYYLLTHPLCHAHPIIMHAKRRVLEKDYPLYCENLYTVCDMYSVCQVLYVCVIYYLYNNCKSQRAYNKTHLDSIGVQSRN